MVGNCDISGPMTSKAFRAAAKTRLNLLAKLARMSISVHPGSDSGALAGRPAAGATSSAEPSGTRPFGTRIRSRLFTKYVALFVAVVAIALLSNGIFEVFFVAVSSPDWFV